jgi:RNA polymerase sigma factor (sigma-70 family)
MATKQTSTILQHARRAALSQDGAGLTDAELLGCFVEHRDEGAFAALVRRHGPMVWGVCRRLLNQQDAEDAFQATFLVLVRKAAAVVPRGMVGNWLYGVAHQTALHARRTAARRKARERQVADMPEPAVVEQELWNDLQPLLDQELSRLPDKYRAVLVLCDLESLTRKEAAQQLGCPEGTIAGRLARARAMLARRLTQRGIAVSSGALAAVLAQNAASACVPAAVLSSTIKVAGLAVAAKVAVTGAISVEVARLTEGVLKTMLLRKLMTAAIVLLVAAALSGVMGLIFQTQAAGQSQGQREPQDKGKHPMSNKKQEPPQKQQPPKEDLTAWGKEVGGLQAGLGLPFGAPRAYHHGEMITLVVRVRNVGKETVKFKYLEQFLDENPPTVTGTDGKTVPQTRLSMLGFHVPVAVTLEPGKEMVLKSHIGGAFGQRYTLRPAIDRGKPMMKEWPLYVGTGKVSLQYARVIGNSSAGDLKVDPTLGQLGTGRLDLEIMPQRNE